MRVSGKGGLSRRGFCLCCVAATGAWLTPSQAFAEAQNLVDVFRNERQYRGPDRS